MPLTSPPPASASIPKPPAPDKVKPLPWLSSSKEFVLKTFSPSDEAGAKGLVDAYYSRQNPYLESMKLKQSNYNLPTPWEKYSPAMSSQFVFNFPKEVYENNFLDHFDKGLDSPFLFSNASHRILSLSIQLQKKEPFTGPSPSPYYLLNRAHFPVWLRASDGVNLEAAVEFIEPHMMDYTIKDMMKLMMSLGFDYAPITNVNECVVHETVKAYVEKEQLLNALPIRHYLPSPSKI